MRKVLLVVAAMACLSLSAATAASAATEVGKPCTATGTEANRTLLVFNVTTAHPVVPEEPAQVITSWQVRVGPGLAPLPGGLNVFPARIPVNSYTGYLALYGPSGTFVCDPAPQLAGSPKLKTAGGKPTRLIVGLGGPKKTVLPGKRVPLRVPLPKAVLRRLGKLAPKESLTAKLTVSCTDLAGRIKHQRLDVKLRGQGG